MKCESGRETEAQEKKEREKRKKEKRKEKEKREKNIFFFQAEDGIRDKGM